MWFYWKTGDKDTKQKSAILAVFGIGLGSLVVTSFLNSLVQRMRPFDVLDTNLLFYKPTDPSFPSNSAVVAFALAAAIFAADKRIGSIAFAIAAFYGFLRVFVGVHFPLDVVAGAAIGVLSVLAFRYFNDFLLKILNTLRSLLRAGGLEEFS